ncbi:hypothetical protein [Kitasatospora sp. NPDC057198]|uniref:hypothetical protein n=1 Tax=Kitasatospora sp. NPDC057198 TaxID=3346046 RepID=UPI003645DA04
MRTRPPRTTLSTCVLLGLPVLLAVAGCRAPGALEDAGAARQVRAHPSAQPLWPAAAPDAAAGRSAAAKQSDAPPAPLPGLVLDTLDGADARTVLAADPALTPDERAALEHGCAGCEVRPARYRDLDGDGSPELLTAVLPGTGPDSPRAVLRVYALHERRVQPVLAVTALPGFTAETVGTDLIVHEPTGPAAETSRTYRWTLGRPVIVDQRVKVTSPDADGTGCLLPTGGCGPASVVVVEPTPVPSASRSLVSGPAPSPTSAPAPIPSASPAVREGR